MQVISSLAQWHPLCHTIPVDRTIGFVPTMGALHAGHLSLVQTSQLNNDLTIVSIYVNPTQFNQADDFTHYPRTLDRDLELLAEAGVDICLVPEQHEMNNDQYRFQITEHALTQKMEGQHRPGHFTGVLTVVMKLLQIVRPSQAYFGEKDYQQFQLIHDMAEAFFLGIRIHACPTIREADGLPYSSRNQRLSPEQRQLASRFAAIFHQSIPIDEIRHQLQALGIRVDYVEEHNHRRFAAVHIGDIRLLDNIPLNVQH